MQFLESLIDADIGDSLRTAALEGQVEVALRTFLVSALEGLSVGVVDYVRSAFICFFAQFL